MITGKKINMADKKNEITVEEARRGFMAKYHPDKTPYTFQDAPPELRQELKQELTEICADQNAWLDQHKGMKYVKRGK